MDDINVRSKVVDTLYSERKEFMIIGLTGRTGTGCSTVASLLEKSFEGLEVPKPKSCGNIEERKYEIVYNFLKENWVPFTKIEMKHVIFTFVLEYRYDDIEKFLYENFKIKNKLESIKERYEKMHEKRICYKNLVSEQNEKGDSVLADDDIYNFYFKEIPEFFEAFQGEMIKESMAMYTEVMQKIGNSVRASGDAIVSDINADNVFKLSQRLNLLIKILRKRNLKSKEKVVIVIDAFRNPYEATFFKDRYSAFYLFSINSVDKERRQRLQKKGLKYDEIKKLDKIEYPNRNNGLEDFFVIDIEKTIELADVHINNKDTETMNMGFTKQQLIRYISLVMHPGLVTPTNIERCMQIAFNSKLNSGCLSRQVGAVITDSDYEILSVGWNAAPQNQYPCNLRDLRALTTGEMDDNIGMSQYERTCTEYKDFLKKQTQNVDFLKLSGRLCSYCFKDAYNAFKGEKNQVYTRSIHAEEMAFLQVSKLGGKGVQGGCLFTTASPCELCSKKACQTGIGKIYYIDQYPGISLEHILNCGENKPEMILFNGVIGRAYNQLYTQILSYKDELYMLMNFKFKKNEVL